MRMFIVSGAYHFRKCGDLYGYGPYVREMNIWISQADEVVVMCELHQGDPEGMDIKYIHQRPIHVIGHTNFEFTSFRAILKSITMLPGILFNMAVQMWKADHIHFRGPASICLIAIFVQILFPWKKKTMKYAGNWDWNFPVPFSYKIQKRIANSTFFTKNIQVLVYGHWPYNSKNILSFYTASYFEREKESVQKDWNSSSPKFLFCGLLEDHKQPLLTYDIFKHILQWAPNATLVFCGGGYLEETIRAAILKDGLEEQVEVTGSIPKNKLKEYYQSSHFLLFYSKSEGWPKAVAESMFWGCIPVTKNISVVPEMLGNGERGILLENETTSEVATMVKACWDEKKTCTNMSEKCINWSRQFTLDKFEEDIKKLVH